MLVTCNKVQLNLISTSNFLFNALCDITFCNSLGLRTNYEFHTGGISIKTVAKTKTR